MTSTLSRSFLSLHWKIFLSPLNTPTHIKVFWIWLVCENCLSLWLKSKNSMILGIKQRTVIAKHKSSILMSLYRHFSFFITIIFHKFAFSWKGWQKNRMDMWRMDNVKNATILQIHDNKFLYGNLRCILDWIRKSWLDRACYILWILQ